MFFPILCSLSSVTCQLVAGFWYPVSGIRFLVTGYWAFSAEQKGDLAITNIKFQLDLEHKLAIEFRY